MRGVGVRLQPKPESNPPAAETVLRELDHRIGGGVEVSLLWSQRTNQVFVSVVEDRNGSSFQVEVPPANALDAFHAFLEAEPGARDAEFATGT